MDLLIKNAHILTINDNNNVIKNGAVYVQDDIIKEIGLSNDLLKKYSSTEKIIDGKGRVVMPGFVCAHMHYYSAFATGMGLKESPYGFVDILEKLWWLLDKALDKEGVYYSALLGNIEAVKSGTTTVIDHHASPSYIKNSLNELERAGKELGVRSSLCYEVTDRNGHDDGIAGLEENKRYIQQCQKNKDDMFSGLVGLHASFTIEEETMALAEEIVKDLNTGVHIHVAEGKADMEHSRSAFNMTVVERLKKYNLLNSKTILAHCLHIEDSDYSILHDTNVNIAHQPRSNMNNAVGSFNIPKFNKSNIPFGLGTDGMSADMKAELLVANLIHKHVQQDNRVGTVDVYNALMYENRNIVNKTMNVSTGSLEIGKKADIIITNYYPKSPINPSNVLGHVLFGVANGAIDTTIINGKVCMEERIIPGIDELAISEKCETIAKETWDRLYT